MHMIFAFLLFLSIADSKFTPVMKSSTISAPIAKAQLKILTFNMLAPCYKRIRSSDTSKSRLFEAEHDNLYMPRCDAICEAVR